MSDECKCGFDHWPILCKDEKPPNQRAESSFAAPAGSAASSQYLARWLPEDGGKAVIVGDWHEVLTAATLFMEMGANKIEIETVRAMPPNSGKGQTQDPSL